jgi:hypothetical protein
MILPRISNLVLLAGAIKAFPLEIPAHQGAGHLEWTPCDLVGLNYSSFKVPTECAKLPVPLGYTDLRGLDTFPLRLHRVNATEEPVSGSVLLNPGDPGSSGVQDTAEKGHI